MKHVDDYDNVEIMCGSHGSDFNLCWGKSVRRELQSSPEILQPWTATWWLPHRLCDQDTCLSGLHCSESRIASDFFLRMSSFTLKRPMSCPSCDGRLQPITTWRLFRFMSRQLLMRCLNFKAPLNGIALVNLLEPFLWFARILQQLQMSERQ